MPRTKAKPAQTPHPRADAAELNGTAGEVFTLSEAASYLRLRESEVLQLVTEQGLPTRHVGAEWRFLKAAVQDWLRSDVPPKSNKDAWTELAGAWKDDPGLEDLLKEIEDQRGR